eukprot:ANDGO_05251.mRNA.1 hypothetical protein SAMD00019534_088130
MGTSVRMTWYYSTAFSSRSCGWVEGTNDHFAGPLEKAKTPAYAIPERPGVRRRGRRMKLCGGCHCGSVRFEVDVPAFQDKQDALEVVLCNCSICDKTAYLHLIVPNSQFHLLTPAENATLYTFNTGVAKHWFCKTCGIKSWYVPRSNPDGISVNARCLDDFRSIRVKITDFDGLNWEKHGHTLAGLTRPQG